jgi:hypothetical protein
MTELNLLDDPSSHAQLASFGSNFESSQPEAPRPSFAVFQNIAVQLSICKE